jgi:hypothetical protein
VAVTVSFIGNLFAFNLTLQRIFHEKFGPNWSNFEDFFFFPKLPDFYNKFQLGAKDIEGFLNIFSCFHIQYVTKFGKIIF